MKWPGPISWPSYPNTATWLNQLLAACRASELKSGVGYLARRSTGGSQITLLPGLREGAAVEYPFEVYESDAGKCKVRAGTVYWHDKSIDVAESVELTPADGNSIWLEIDDEFAVTPTFTASVGATPTAATHAPARNTFLLATVAVSGGTLTITQKWWGGNIPWPTIFGFYL